MPPPAESNLSVLEVHMISDGFEGATLGLMSFMTESELFNGLGLYLVLSSN